MRFAASALLAAPGSASLGVGSSWAVGNPGAKPGAAPSPTFGTTRYFYEACKSSLDEKNSEELFRQGQCSGELFAMSSVKGVGRQACGFALPPVSRREKLSVLSSRSSTDDPGISTDRSSTWRSRP